MFSVAGSGDAKKYEDSTIQPHRILLSKTANTCADLRFWNRRDLVHHQPAGSPKSVAFARLNQQAKQRSIGRVGREGA